MMKNLQLILMLLISITLKAQTINASTETIGKELVEGFYINMNIDSKNVEKDWMMFLNKFGDVEKRKGIIYMSKAEISTISKSQIKVTSKVSGVSNKTTVFWSLDLGSGNFIKSNTDEFKEVEGIMRDFFGMSMKNEEIRLAERDLEEAQKNLDKVDKTGEKLRRDAEKNLKEYDNLLKKIDENKKEAINIEDLRKQNVKDIEAAKLALKQKDEALKNTTGKKKN